MKQVIRLILLVCSIATAHFALAQGNDLNINGIASFEQLRKEYYIGALYLGWPGHDPAAIANMPGKKRMELHITADRWPSLRFAQTWNQLITINNPSATLNANASDMLAFTSLPKGDLVEGDNIVIELTANNTTQVMLNGIPALRTGSSALFTMLLNSWIGQRPPSSEFKRDILDLQKAPTTNDLIARYQAVHPAETRKRVIAGWGFKLEPENAAPAVTSTTSPAIASVSPTPAAVPAAAPKKVEPPKAVEPEPKASSVAAASAPAKAVAVSAPVVDTAAQLAEQQAREAQAKAKQQLQSDLYDSYLSEVRKLVVRNVEYPKRAQKENIEGLVMMRVRIDRSGSLASYELAQSADDMLDEAAVKAVKKAAPFPKASEQMEGNTFEFLIPMVFKLAQ